MQLTDPALRSQSVRPWNRYPLTLRFLAPDGPQLLRGCRALPPHVRTASDTLDTLSLAVDESDEDSDMDESWAESSGSVAEGLQQAGARAACFLCEEQLHTPYIKCGCGAKATGQMRAHLSCLAREFLGAEVVARPAPPALSAGLFAAASAPSCRGSRERVLVDRGQCSSRRRRWRGCRTRAAAQRARCTAGPFALAESLLLHRILYRFRGESLGRL